MNCLESALEYIEQGLSIIPAHPTRKNATISSWLPYQKNRATKEEVKKWFGNGHDFSPAIITGAISGNLELLDFDEKARQFNVWSDLVTEQCPGLVERLVQQTTQNGGKHIAYRCQGIDIPGNQKLSTGAVVVSGPGLHKIDGKEYKAVQYRGLWVVTPTLIETRGSGGYFLAHPGKGYQVVVGSFSDIPEISPDERKILIESAAVLSEYVIEQPSYHEKPRQQEYGITPWDDFNNKTDIQKMLIEDGWKKQERAGAMPDGTPKESWCRPGKNIGTSATVYDNKVHIWTSNASPLQAGITYKPFGMYMAIAGLDSASAAKELREKGFGGQTRQRMTTDDNTQQQSVTIDTVDTHIRQQGDDRCGSISGLVRDFLDENEGEFSTAELDRELSLFTRFEKQARSNALGRFAKELKVKKVKGKVGKWKVVKGGLEVISFDQKVQEPIRVPMALGLSEMALFYPSNIILVVGSPNAGKTSFLLSSLYTLLIKEKEKRTKKEKEKDRLSSIIDNGVRYLSSEMAETEIQASCDRFPNGNKIFSEGCQFVKRSENFADVIIPDGINYIDYLQIYQDYFDLGKLINEIHEELDGGICFIACQKSPDSDYAKGGFQSNEKPRLSINLDANEGYGYICKIKKLKHSTDRKQNHNGKEADYIVTDDGVKRCSAWRFVKPRDRKSINLAYEVNGMEPIPDKDYAFLIRVTGGESKGILQKQVAMWQKEHLTIDVESELRRIEADSLRKPFLDPKKYFFQIAGILNGTKVQR